jgi:4-carboxymuconolactone decarboxylase
VWRCPARFHQRVGSDTGSNDRQTYREVLVRLAFNDESFIESVMDPRDGGPGPAALAADTAALVQLAALLALDAAPASYSAAAALAQACGATLDQIVGVLVAIAPSIGAARTVSAAPSLALAIGFDVEDELHGRDSTSL